MFKSKLIVIFLLSISLPALAKGRYSDTLCHVQNMHCITINPGEKWKTLWPDDTQRHLVMRLNRMNVGLTAGMTIAVPDHLDHVTLMDVAPFPAQIDATGKKMVVADLSVLAWGAYDADGKLINWGPASGGKGFCPDIQAKCKTVTGTFTIQRKGDTKCKSNTYPVDKPGAPMPYCMFFYRGWAIHGSNQVPGYNASHGCVRVWVDDAKWLNQEFTTIGTQVIVHD